MFLRVQVFRRIWTLVFMNCLTGEPGPGRGGSALRLPEPGCRGSWGTNAGLCKPLVLHYGGGASCVFRTFTRCFTLLEQLYNNLYIKFD